MEYKDYATGIKFLNSDGIFVRVEKGFYFYLKDWEYLVYNIPSIFVTLDKSIDKDLLKKFEQAALNNACSLQTINNKNDTLIISLPDGNKESEKFIEDVDSIISRVVKLFEIEDIKPLNLCPICKKDGTYSRFGDNFTPIHKECIAKYVDQLKEIVNKGQSSKFKPVLSILLSLIFSLIGLLPALLLCLFTHNYFTPLLVLIPLGSVGGYFLVKANTTKWLKLITSLIPLMVIILFSIFSIPFMVKMNELTFGDYLFYDGWVGIRKIIFSSLFLFGGFGMMKLFSQFKKDYAKELEKFEK